MRTRPASLWLFVCAFGLIVSSIASADPGMGAAPAAASRAESAELPPEPEPDVPGSTPAIERPEALAPFFAALARTDAGEGITRVTHLGDSSIGGDGLPHGVRRRLQARFGDAGPGFVLIQQPNESYVNRTISARAAPPWRDCVVVHRCQRDGYYGLGGVSAESRGRSTTTFALRDGRRVTSAELWYLAQPRGGRVAFSLGDARAEIDTHAEAPEDRWRVLEAPEGATEVRVRALGGRVRLYGVVLENEGPGVVWDGLPMVGAFTRRLLELDEAHFARQLARRDPDMVVLNYGGNDLRRIVSGAADRAQLEAETGAVLARVRAAVPDAACLVLGINDHARAGGRDVRPRHLSRVLAAQRAAAAQAGCAFWDQLAAMGGAGSFRTWRRRGLAAGDGKHLSADGRAVMAARLHAALMHAMADSVR